jgi:hypothetical protein
MSGESGGQRAAFAAEMSSRGVLLGAGDRERLMAQADALPPVGGPLDALLLMAGSAVVVLAEPVDVARPEGPWRYVSINGGDATLALPPRAT